MPILLRLLSFGFRSSFTGSVFLAFRERVVILVGLWGDTIFCGGFLLLTWYFLFCVVTSILFDADCFVYLENMLC
jgi:hypothetical protein